MHWTRPRLARRFGADSISSHRVAPLLREIVASGYEYYVPSVIDDDGPRRERGLHGQVSFKRMEGTYMTPSPLMDDAQHSSANYQTARSTRRLPARAVTVKLLHARSPQELYACLRQYEEDASCISISAGLTHLTKLCERLAIISQGVQRVEKDAAESALMLSSRIMLREVVVEPQQTRCLANVIWASAKLASILSSSSSPRGPAEDKLILIARDLASELASAFASHPHAKEANGFDLSNTAYGLATLSLSDHIAWERLLIPQSIELAKLGALDPQPLSNIIWALGKVQIKSRINPLPALIAHALGLIKADIKQPSLLPKPRHTKTNQDASLEEPKGVSAKAKVVVAFDSVYRHDSISAIVPQFLANICWAMARLNHKDTVFLRAAATLFLSKEATSLLPPNMQNISSICWAFATLEVPCPDLFLQLKPKVKSLAESRKLGTLALSNLCWSYAKAGAYCPELFASLSDACLAAVPRFNSQELVNVAWAMAFTCHREKALMAAIARAALPLLPRLDPIEISQLLWSLASLNFSSEKVCNAVSELAEKQMFSQSQRRNSASSHHQHSSSERPSRRIEAGSSDDEDALRSYSRESSIANPWKMQAMTNTCWSFSVMRPYDARLFKAIYAEVARQIEQGGRGRYSEGFNPLSHEIRHARQLYQAHLAHQLSWRTLKAASVGQNIPPPPGLTDSPAEMPPKLLEMCKQAWVLNIQRGVHSSNSQRMIQAGLQRLGYRCKSEFVLNHLLCVDILLHHPKGVDLVIEVDGPQHFANDGSSLGEHHLRNRLIRSLGYPLLCIKVVDWSELDEDKRQGFLRDKVEAAVLQELESKGPVVVAQDKRRFHRSSIKSGGGAHRREQRQRPSLNRQESEGGIRAPRVKNTAKESIL